MERRSYKPTIVSLREHLSKSGTKLSNLPRHPFQSHNNSFTEKKYLESSMSNCKMASEFDVELGNDFEWLINFNLKTILSCDIDDGLYENNDSAKRNERFQRKENVLKADRKYVSRGESTNGKKKNASCSKSINPNAFSEIIEECLCEKDEVTVKAIFKWIRERHPWFTSQNRKWKNFVRLTLVKNPLFQVKKCRRGRSEIWYLDQSYAEHSKHFKSYQQASPVQINSDKSIMIQSTDSNMLSSLICSPAKEYFTAYGPPDTVQENISEVYSENWFESAGFQVKYLDIVKNEIPTDCYEIEIPLETEYLEAEKYTGSLEVPSFLDEGSSSMSLEHML